MTLFCRPNNPSDARGFLLQGMSGAKSVFCGTGTEDKSWWSIGERAAKKSQHDIILSMSDRHLAERGGHGSLRPGTTVSSWLVQFWHCSAAWPMLKLPGRLRWSFPIREIG